MSDLRTEIVTQVAALRRYALALTRDGTEAEELVQETLVRGIAAAASWQPGTDLRAWLFRIMRNAWLDALRRRATRERAALDGSDSVTEPTQPLHVEIRRAVEALRKLPKAQREAIALVAFADMSYAEAADAMDVPLGTFMSRLARGREALRRLLEKQGPPRPRSGAGTVATSTPARTAAAGPCRPAPETPCLFSAPRMKTPVPPVLCVEAHEQDPAIVFGGQHDHHAPRHSD